MARPIKDSELKAARLAKRKELKSAKPGVRITMCVHQMYATPVLMLPWYDECPVCHKDRRPRKDHPHWLTSTLYKPVKVPKKETVQISMF